MYIRLIYLFLFSIYFIKINAKNLQNNVTTTATPTTTLQRSTVDSFDSHSDGLNKRELKENYITTAETTGLVARSHDPPAGFYRDPGSTGHLSSTQSSVYYNNYRPYNAFLSRHVAFPDNGNNYYNKYSYNGGVGEQKDSSYNPLQHLKAKVGLFMNKKDALQDRISVGNYGTSPQESNASGGYSSEGHPYTGYAHHINYYGSSVAPTAHTAGYYGGGTAAEGIPFDIYGTKNHYSGSSGNDYPSSSYSEAQPPSVHKSHADISHKVLLAKSFLIPLASATVLGIAAALISNPLLLQLGTVSGVAPSAVIYGKRKRRHLTTSAVSNSTTTNSFEFIVSSIDKTKKDGTKPLYSYHDYHRQQI